MSDASQVIVDIEASEAEAARLAEEIRAWLAAQGVIAQGPSDCVLGEGEGYAPGPGYGVALVPGSVDEFLRLRTNGLCLRAGRAVFDPGANGTELRCEACGVAFEPGDDWFDAVGAWAGGDDDASFACPDCQRTRRLAEWRGPWPWGFGNLGLEFWNWPPLSDAFVRAVGERLQHRVVVVRSHL